MASSAVSTGKSATRRAGASTPSDGTPYESPAASTSSTSLSSVASDDVALNKTVQSETYGKLVDTYGNVFEPPNYTIKDIHNAIPKHCFQRSALHGYLYIIRDLSAIASIFYVAYNYLTPEFVPSYYARAALWALYTIAQGLFATGIWVIAHECGHQAFSESRLVNDATGFVLHSCLLVPYFSWKMSHGKHHKATGHMERDMVFLPRTREQHASKLGKLVEDLGELTEETPIAAFVGLIAQQLFGWPLYLICNVTGHNNHDRQREGRGKGKNNGFGGGVNHFNPYSPLFETRDIPSILASDVGIILSLSGLFYLGNTYGWSNMLVWYWIPYLWVNHWLVAITFLQHTDPTLPHYTADSWNFVRGAAATIDREFGFIGHHILHHIIETHVLHHYISTIPFYKAQEATEAIKKVMGSHYRADTQDGALGFLRAMWTTTRWCQWVEPSLEAEGAGNEVLFFRNHNRLGTKPMTAEQYKKKVGKA
ncbi:Delta(12) fatty acid desaturase [Ceratocystis lukuohia]|uniref:Delta(12) fatty acid desaturase n=3 Tax=Ceratocystis TaxID=5157 RepID=A0A0F8B1E6_CERFI|nr:Delta(12) fatty acid desaturase [Ceratocystis platani]PHH50703.1 Delta(12) fatty acid desaturase [Ceratocystis fimbriata CBS 114723]